MKYNAQDLIENISTAVITTDETFNIVYANVASEQLFGISRSKLSHYKIVDFIEQDSIKKSILDLKYRTFQEYSTSDITFITDPHHSFKANINVSLNNNDQNPGFIFEIFDFDLIQKLSDDNQKRSQHLAARDLIRRLAHEIKNPLGGIRGAAQLLEMTLGKDKNVTDYTNVIISEADRLKNLVNMLLGPQKANPRRLYNIHFVIEKVLSLESMDCKGSVNFERDYDPSLPDIVLDDEAMQQVFLNIIKNAIEAMHNANIHHPTIKIQTRAKIGAVVNSKKYSTSIAVNITDNGPGIPENIKDMLFYPLVSQNKEDGHGLGLSIAQSIVENHSGTIECDSEKGRTTFTILLPIKKTKTNEE